MTSANPDRPLRSLVFDLAVAAWMALFATGGVLSNPGEWQIVLVGLLMAGALPWRRRHPLLVMAVVAALALVQVIAGMDVRAFDIAVLIAIYTLVKYAERLRDVIVAGVIATLGVLFGALDTRSGVWWANMIFLGLVTGSVWLVALNVRTRRLYVFSLEERATTLEREREAEARAAVAEERTRIARELHDVVAHGMAVMIVQADGARYTVDRDPATAREAMRTVAETGRQALEDMRRLVGVLREDGPPTDSRPGTPDEGGVREPVHRRPTLAELPALVDRFRVAGLRVRHTVLGKPPALPPGLDLTVYRLVQEALTNALKHSGVATAVEVIIDHSAPGAVVVRVVDDGQGHRPVEAPSGGHGLVGMRERVGVYDGHLTAGPRLGGGWQVEARLPLPTVAAEREV